MPANARAGGARGVLAGGQSDGDDKRTAQPSVSAKVGVACNLVPEGLGPLMGGGLGYAAGRPPVGWWGPNLMLPEISRVT